MPCLGDNRTVNITNHQSLDRSERSSTSDHICTSTPKDSESRTISRKYATQGEIPRNTRRRKKRTAQQSMGGRSFEDCISEFSPTSDKSVVTKTSQTKNNSGAHRNYGMFYHSLNFGKEKKMYYQALKTYFSSWPQNPKIKISCISQIQQFVHICRLTCKTLL